MATLESILNNKYPLCHIFRDISDDGVIFYDGKANFAFFITEKEERIICKYLESDFLIDWVQTEEERKIVPTLETFRKAGLFLPGPLLQVSSVDNDELEKLIHYYHDNILQRKYVLEATEDCNFRCTYCFNTIHEGTGLRHHTRKSMSLDIAKKSIDYYFIQYVKIYKKLSAEKQIALLNAVPPTLSWYGGETTLNWSVLVAATDYFKSKPWEENGIDPKCLSFSLNTNMSVLTDDMLRFVVEHDYLIFASIDGPKAENDKCRVFPDGSGTYDIVMKNLRKIKDYAPDYFKRRVIILSVEADSYDIKACRDYFNHWEFPELEVSPSGQEREDCVYSDPEMELKDINANYHSDLEHFKELIDSADIENPGKDINTLIKYTGIQFDNPSGSNILKILLTCPMGIDNNMVGVDGEIHICHKTDGSYSFGNINSLPIDYSRLVELYRKHNECVNHHCTGCWAVHICDICGARRLRNGEFKNPTSRECDVIRADKHLILSATFYAALKRPELFKRLKEKAKESKDYISIIDINEF